MNKMRQDQLDRLDAVGVMLDDLIEYAELCEEQATS